LLGIWRERRKRGREEEGGEENYGVGVAHLAFNRVKFANI
jgi:hypothetical protein